MRLCVFPVLCAMLAAVGGCQKVSRTNEAQLKPIKDMLDAQVPVGAPEANVLTYLKNRGYPLLPAAKQGTIVASVRHIDTQTVTPVTARVTFYFDANHRLNTYELRRSFNEPVPEAKPEQEVPGSAPRQVEPSQP